MKAGAKLRNGATVVEAKPSRRWDSNWVVLAQWGKEYVTWIVDQERNACWGHYYQDMNAAWHDYFGRT